ncbi:MAG: transposase [Acidobacteriia bacterium]|nr:transposase [Terriglobia bacterium]
MPFYLKRLRLPREDYRGRRICFVTICCEKRRPVFADLSLGRCTLSYLAESAARRSFSLHSFCLMPDHLHFLAEGMDDACDLVKFIHVFKQRTAFACRRSNSQQLWQTRFYDHILRRAEAIEDVACYIRMNPVRQGLCTDPHLYPLSGSQTIDWMKRSLASTEWLPPWKRKPPG